MTRITQTYPFKLPQERTLRQQLDWLQTLATQAAQQLLARLWTDDWVLTLATSKNKAYKVIGEQEVRLITSGQMIYLPSRIRRCIAEQVGRILRSQATRKACYEDVLRIVQRTGVEGSLDTLVQRVAVTLVKFDGKYYRWALIRQTLRTFRRYYYRLGLDLEVLRAIPHTSMVQPLIRRFVLPYAPDDGQALNFEVHPDALVVQMKLPRTAAPCYRHHWDWQTFKLPVPPKLQSRIQLEQKKVHRPTLRYLTLKGGLNFPFLEFAWTVEPPSSSPVSANRVLATDLGVINLTTSVIVEAGLQVSQPVFWSPPKTILLKIEQLYQNLSRLQRKIDRYSLTWSGQGKRVAERDRLYRKLTRFRELILHLTTNQLLATALREQCQTLVLEDLRTYEPPHQQRKLSRKLSNWLRGAVYDILLYKAKRVGLKVRRVNARWTSTYCPRCRQKGQKITDPRRKMPHSKGRFFHCPGCQFTADRDYIAALNIARMHDEQQNNRFSLKTARPVPYMAAGIPLNRPSGASPHLRVGG